MQAAPINKQGGTEPPQVATTETQGESKVATPHVKEKEQKAKAVVPASGNAIEVKPTQHPVGCQNYTNEIAKYNWNVSVMRAICQAESGGRPSAIGDNYPIRGLHAPSCGLFQIRTLPSRPTCAELQDPATNIAWAYRIYQGQGYKAWSVCRTVVNCY